TMEEIASDLNISKASLYYYFPDKLTIYAEVLQSLSEKESLKNDEYLMEDDPLKSFFKYLDNRTKFFNQNINILDFLNNISANPPKELEQFFSKVRNSELMFIKSLLEKAKQNGLISSANISHYAEYWLAGLSGLRINAFRLQNFFSIEKKTYQDLLKKEKEFSTIFYNGIIHK
ncbi:MAG: TetR/AcrR family transcriptional regulator, partial [Ferruginibacter sp.]